MMPLEKAKAAIHNSQENMKAQAYDWAKVEREEAQVYALIAIADVLERMYKWDRA